MPGAEELPVFECAELGVFFEQYPYVVTLCDSVLKENFQAGSFFKIKMTGFMEHITAKVEVCGISRSPTSPPILFDI